VYLNKLTKQQTKKIMSRSIKKLKKQVEVICLQIFVLEHLGDALEHSNHDAVRKDIMEAIEN